MANLSSPSLPPEHHVTAPKDRVPAGQKIAAGFGGIFESLTTHAIPQLANPILNIGLGMSPSLVGLALAIPRLFDAIIDPVIGSFSDNLKSRWGRRRPLMLIGALLTTLCLIAMWWLPSRATLNFHFWHFLIISVFFYTAAAIFVIPWQALLVEMSEDYHERTRVQAYQSIISIVGLVCLPWLFAATKMSIFPNILVGVRWVGLALGLFIVLAGLVPVLFVRETSPVATKTHERIPFWHGLRQTMENRPFLIMIAILLLYNPASLMIEGLGLYVNIYYVCHGNLVQASILQGYGGTIQYLSKFLWIPVMTWVATRWGKRKTLVFCLSFLALAMISKWFCYTPLHPYLQLVVPIIYGIGGPPTFVLISSMFADTIDLDRIRTGLQREGLFMAVAQWVRKVATTVAFGLSGLILSWTGFDIALGKLQHPETILWMRILFTTIPATATILAIILAGIYPITEERAYEIRRELEQQQARES